MTAVSFVLRGPGQEIHSSTHLSIIGDMMKSAFKISYVIDPDSLADCFGQGTDFRFN
jgi:hypothetical protein